MRVSVIGKLRLMDGVCFLFDGVVEGIVYQFWLVSLHIVSCACIECSLITCTQTIDNNEQIKSMGTNSCLINQDRMID